MIYEYAKNLHNAWRPKKIHIHQDFIIIREYSEEINNYYMNYFSLRMEETESQGYSKLSPSPSVAELLYCAIVSV